VNFQLLQNFAEMSKFHSKGKIPWIGSKFRSPWKTVGPTNDR